MKDTKDIISIKNYSYKYAGDSTNTIENINLDIKEGEFILLCGPTGCGKSTLLKSIVGIMKNLYDGEESGSIQIENIDIKKLEMDKISQKVGFVFQDPENQIFMFNVERDIAFGLENLGIEKDDIKKRIDDVVELLKIKKIINKAPHELSDGQKQRVALAGTLVMKPIVLILDEPTSMLDPKTAYDFLMLLNDLKKNRNITIIVVEHRLDLLIEIADRIVIMDKGKILGNGHPKNIIEHNKNIIKSLGLPLITQLSQKLNKEIKNIDTVFNAEELIKELEKNRN